MDGCETTTQSQVSQELHHFQSYTKRFNQIHVDTVLVSTVHCPFSIPMVGRKILDSRFSEIYRLLFFYFQNTIYIIFSVPKV